MSASYLDKNKLERIIYNFWNQPLQTIKPCNVLSSERSIIQFDSV